MIDIKIRITKHSINKARQRFNLEKDYKKVKNRLKKAFIEGKVIDKKNKFDFTVNHEGMYLIITAGVLKTVLTQEQYEDNRRQEKKKVKIYKRYLPTNKIDELVSSDGREES